MCCNSFRIILMFLFAALSFVFNNFMPSVPVLVFYLISINIFTFFIFSIDKYHSIKDRKRVPEMSLHFFSLAGGIIGALLSMLIFRHKIRKKVFMLAQIVILLLWMLSTYYIFTNFETIQKVIS